MLKVTQELINQTIAAGTFSQDLADVLATEDLSAEASFSYCSKAHLDPDLASIPLGAPGGKYDYYFSYNKGEFGEAFATLAVALGLPLSIHSEAELKALFDKGEEVGADIIINP
jgi:hypothetical protein